jgi:hypothetical protein
VVDIIVGAIFLFIGLMACCIAAIRRRSGARIFIWLGIWSAMYDAEHLTQSPIVLGVSPRGAPDQRPLASTAMTHLEANKAIPVNESRGVGRRSQVCRREIARALMDPCFEWNR